MYKMDSTPIKLTQETMTNPEQGLKYEWYEANGLGAYASSTAIDCHTRKYHGLLVTPIEGQANRHVLLSKMEPEIEVNGKVFHLSTNKYPGVYHPAGHRYTHEFESDYNPVTTYKIGDLVLEKSILMPYEENAIMIRYKLISAEKKITFRVLPFLAYRNFHDLMHENMDIQVKFFKEKKGWKTEPYGGLPPLYFDCTKKVDFCHSPEWFKDVEYLKEYRRGYDHKEDLFSPGMFEAEMKEGDELIFKVGLDEDLGDIKKSWKKEIKRRENERKKLGDSEIVSLKENANKFLITKKRQNKPSILAGFPWFGEWGRDSMISVSGLTLFSGQEKLAFQILKAYASEEKGGLIPNQLGVDFAEPTYNSIDASLWFFWAIQNYEKATGDRKGILKYLLPTMSNILKAYEDNNIAHGKLQDNGLLYIGDESTQLTWMDARIGSEPVTPRYGYPVEINALWINAIRYVNDLLESEFEQTHPVLHKKLDKLNDNFQRMFWISELNYCADVVNEKGQDKSVRCNQVFAVSLPYSPLSAEQQKQVVERIEKELLTPFGLRTLSPKNILYRGKYGGSQAKRDGAYHQGTVWPWLIGSYVEAKLKTSSNIDDAKVLKKLLAHLIKENTEEYGIGSIAEIHDGTAPHHQRGCPMQAWSVAETIRGYELVEARLAE